MIKQSKHSNHPRIISVTPISGGWNVVYHGRVLTEKQVPTVRTTNLKTGALLKKPVLETHIESDVPAGGVISRVVKRRTSLRKLGVAI